MANYSLVANTAYKARTFEDLIRPYALYTQEYRNQEDAIADLAAKADVWKSMANAQTDPMAYATITNYADALRNQASVMASRGLDSSSRQAMLNLKRRYASEITPVEQAFKTRQLQAAEQQQARMKDPTLMMSRRADATSLDDYIDNPTLGYDAYSGALLTQQVGTAAAKLATELREYGNGKRLDQFTKTWLQKHGYSASEVAFAINNPDDPRANSVLNTIVSNVMADSGMDKWADNRTLNQAYNYARQGLWQAVGQSSVATYEDYAAKLAAQRAQTQDSVNNNGNNNIPSNPKLPLYGIRRVATNKQMDEKVSDYNFIKDYFYKKNGKWRMNSKGRTLYKQEMRSLQDQQKSTWNAVGKQSTSSSTPFIDVLKRHGLLGIAEGRYGYGQYKTLDDMKSFYDNKDYDTTLSSEYTLNLDPNDFKKVVAVMGANSDKNNQLNNYTYATNNDGSYYLEKDGSKINIKDLDDSKVKSAMLVYGNHGTYYEIKLEDKTIKVPLSTTIQKNKNVAQGWQDKVNELNDYLSKGVKYVVRSDGSTDSVESLIEDGIGSWGETLLNNLGLVNTKNQSYTPQISLE